MTFDLGTVGHHLGRLNLPFKQEKNLHG